MDTLNSAVDALGNWLLANEREINIWSIAAVTLLCLYLSRVKGKTWLVIRNQRDRTNVGVSLKRQKIAETWMFACWAALYALSLWTLLDPGIRFGVWERMALRCVLVVSMVAAAVFGNRLIAALDDPQARAP